MSKPAGEDLFADRYRLDGVLGSGGMADVHRAWDTHLCRFVAIKLFRPNADVTAGRRFDSEVRTLAALSHPGLVSVYDARVTERASFVVLQLVDGRTLHDRIARGPMTPTEVRALGVQLADALAYVHAHGVVHRDVKPSNILLDPAGTAYLTDFGLARLTTATRITRTGQLVGTAAYFAPEQVRGGEIGFPLDVYALGLVLLECLTGQREYQGSELEAAVVRLHRPPAVPQDLPDGLRRLLERMTSPAPDQRPTAHDCAQALRETAVDPPRPPPTRVAPIPRATPKKALLGVAAVAGLALAVLTGAESPTSAPTGSVPRTTTPVATTPPPVAAEPVVTTSTSTVVVVVEQRPGDSGKGKDVKPEPRGHGQKKNDP